MKTIGYVLGAFPVLSETFVGTEMRALQAHGHHVVPIVLTRHDEPGQERDADLARRSLHLDEASPRDALAILARSFPRAPRWLSFARRQKGLPPRSLIWNSAKVAAVAQRHGCEHLHAHFAWAAAAHAITAARMIGCPVSFVGHGSDINATPVDLGPKLEAADFTVAVSGELVDKLRAIAPGARIELVHTGIDPDRFSPADASAPGNGRLLFVGRLVPCKGVDVLLHALAQLAPEERPAADIVGYGPEEAPLRKLAAELGLGKTIEFLGCRQADWIIRHGPHYTAFVGPFRQAADGAKDTGPVVVKEAMAMGLPVIGTTLPGILDLVTPDTGLIVPPDSPEALAQAIRAIGRMSSDERRTMGRAGRRRVQQNFTDQVQAARLSALFESV